MNRSGSASTTLYFDEHGQRVYPCWCGETHSGPYGDYDHDHHNCLHREHLHVLDAELDPGHLICPSCGQSFRVKGSLDG